MGPLINKAKHKPKIAKFNFDSLLLMMLPFTKKHNARFVSFKIIGFASIIIVGFDFGVMEVANIVICMVHARFFTKVAISLKTKIGFDGRQWTFIQDRKSKFLFTSSILALWVNFRIKGLQRKKLPQSQHKKCVTPNRNGCKRLLCTILQTKARK